MRLHEQRNLLESEREEARVEIQIFLKYLASSKFHEDDSIRTWEVSDLLVNLRNILT